MTDEHAAWSRKELGISLNVVFATILLPYFVELIAGYILGDPSLAERDLSHALKQEMLKTTLVVGSINLVYAVLGIGALLVGVKSISGRRFPPAGMPVPFRITVHIGSQFTAVRMLFFTGSHGALWVARFCLGQRASCSYGLGSFRDIHQGVRGYPDEAADRFCEVCWEENLE